MPYVRVFVDVSDALEELEDDDIADEMKKRGFWCFKKGSGDAEDFSSVQHLLDCGMRDEAKKEALEIVGQMMGKPL